jgi:hypothetical protein
VLCYPDALGRGAGRRGRLPPDGAHRQAQQPACCRRPAERGRWLAAVGWLQVLLWGTGQRGRQAARLTLGGVGGWCAGAGALPAAVGPLPPGEGHRQPGHCQGVRGDLRADGGGGLAGWLASWAPAQLDRTLVPATATCFGGGREGVGVGGRWLGLRRRCDCAALSRGAAVAVGLCVLPACTAPAPAPQP